MARLIDADAMKEELLWGNVYLSDNETNALVDLIENQPTIDPESLRPRSYWEDVYQTGPCSFSGRCHACGVRNDIPPVEQAYYCAATCIAVWGPIFLVIYTVLGL